MRYYAQEMHHAGTPADGMQFRCFDAALIAELLGTEVRVLINAINKSSNNENNATADNRGHTLYLYIQGYSFPAQSHNVSFDPTQSASAGALSDPSPWALGQFLMEQSYVCNINCYSAFVLHFLCVYR